MPSGRTFSLPFNSPPPIIEIATYQPSPTEKSVHIALKSSPYDKSTSRPNTTESDNQTVCLNSPEQHVEDKIRKKVSQRLNRPNEEENEENGEQGNMFTVGLESEKLYPDNTKNLDIIILPFTFLIYLSDYLQRSNISNGALYGLRIDVLDNSHLRYALVLSSFSITYLVTSIGSNIIIPDFRFPHKSLSWAVFITSIASIMIGFSSNFGTVFFCRSLIGIGGAILGKSMEVYYSLMYTQSEMAKRMSFFIGSAVLAGALNGIIAFAIGFIKSETKIWSILYFFEGGLGILLAVICHICLPSPRLKKKLEIKTREINFYNNQSLSEINSFNLNSDLFEWSLLKKTLLNFNIWISSFAYGCINLSVGSLTGYLPCIIESFGNSPRNSQILTTGPYLFAFIIMFLIAKASDKSGIRSIFIIVISTTGAIGWLLLLKFNSMSIRYLAIFLVVTGAYCPIPLTLSWTLSNCTSCTQRATSFIILQIFGQIFTVASNFIFHTHGDENWSENLGFLINLIANVSTTLSVSCLAAWYYYQNSVMRSVQHGDTFFKLL